MNMITFSEHLSSINRLNNTSKTSSDSNQKTLITSPVSKLIMPDSELLKVSFTGKTSPADSKARRFLTDYENELNDNKNAKLKTDFELGKVTLDDIKPGADLSKKNLIYFDFVKHNKTDISGIILKETLLNSAVLNGVKISDEEHKADLTKAILDEAQMDYAQLDYANLKGAHLHAAKLNNASLIEANLESTQMNGAKFNEATMTNANLKYAWLMGAEFRGADLTDADFTHAQIKWTDFRGSWLLGADLKKSPAINSSKFNGAYYNNETKLPDDFKPEDHDMIFVPESKEEEFYTEFKSK